LIRAVLVDLGDTLVHLSRAWNDVFQDNLNSLHAFLKSEGMNSDFDEFAKSFVHEYEGASAISHLYKVEVPMQDIVARVLRKNKLKDAEGNLVQGAIEEFYKPEIEAWQTYPDTVQTLTALHELGFRMGLISNAKSDWAVRAILDKCDISRFFETIVTSAAVLKRKPRFDIFMQALTALGVKSSETIFIGDSLQADVLGAKTARMRSIHVCREPVTDSCCVVPDVTVSSLTQALEQVINWNNALRERTTPKLSV